MVYAPAYKDTYYTSTTSLSYYIQYNGATIFAGKATKMPGQQEVKININKIAQDYLGQSLNAILTGATTDTGSTAMGTFSLYNAASGVKIEDYMFLHCYDYSFNWTGTTGVTLSNPICDQYAAGVKVLTTRINSSRKVVTTASTATNLKCVRYCLYYVNARGGWDAFCIQGASQKKDAITQFLTDKAFNNNTREFEANRYLSEIKTSYILNTHYLTDEQSENLAKNLLSSNLVYMHDLTENKIFPVIITDTSVTYQTYQTNGKKMAQYKINVTESQSKLRR